MGVARARELRKSMTVPEATMWNRLRPLKPLGYHFRRQVPLGSYYVDFCCHRARLIIEVDGATHFQPDALVYDQRRDMFLRMEGYRVLRFSNADAAFNPDGVMTAILNALENASGL